MEKRDSKMIKQTHFPTEADELMGLEDERVHISEKDLEKGSFEAVVKVFEKGQWKALYWDNDKENALLLDVFTAQAVILVYDNLKKQASKDKFKRMMAASPAQFKKVIDFVWNNVIVKPPQ
jgi:hypothetical protein